MATSRKTTNLKKKNNVVLVVDGGGRGAALVDAYAKSKYVSKILAVPGNDLMQINTKKKVMTYPHLKTTSVKEIVEIAKKEKVDLVDIAQDNAVAAGTTNALQKAGIATIGPTKEAGQIEWDKVWARELLKKTRAPQPDYQWFDNFEKGIRYIKSQKDKSWFVKAAGLAEGKGALPAKNNKEAIEKIKEQKKFGKAGEHFLIEEWLVGEEFSAFILTDGKNFQFIGCAQDHKRVFDNDQGENTGGMGCSAPPLAINKKILDQTHKLLSDTLHALTKEERPYQGILYLGGIIVNKNGKQKVYVIEFNARWGDPEAEVLIPSIKNDLFELSMSVAQAKLNTIKVRTDTKARVAVAGCSRGYPGDYSRVKGKEIFGLDTVSKMDGTTVYSAGIRKEKKRYFANGGRLFYLVSEGKNVLEARKRAYGAMSQIYIEGNNLHYRTDIGWRDVERLAKNMI